MRCGRIIAGPGVYICDECMELCREIIEEEFVRMRQPMDLNGYPRSRHEIVATLDEYVDRSGKGKEILLRLRYTTTISALRRRQPKS